MTKPAVNNFRDKWNAIEPQKRRYILFAGLIAMAMFLAFAVKPDANQQVQQEDDEQKVETTVMTPEKPAPNLEKLLSSNEALRKAFEDTQKANDKLVQDKALLEKNNLEQASQQAAQTQSELTSQVAGVQQELKLLKMAKDGADVVPLPALPELSGAAAMPLGDPNQIAANVDTTPAAPRLVYVRKSSAEQESPVPSSLTKGASELKSTQKLSQYLLTAGSILEGVLLSGMDAPTSAAAKKNPYPALIRIKKEAILPNYYRQNVRECFVIVSGFGELSSERARLRTERVSCVRNDGTVIESDISGYVTGEDGKVGVRGRLVTKQGAVIAKSLAAGALAGFGENITPTAIPQLSLDSSEQQQFQRPNAKQAAEVGVYRGISEAAGAVSQFYLEMAKEMVPVIEVDAGRKVNIILVRGVNLALGGADGGQEKTE
ncbi:conjugal transfer protein TraB [Moraxellaceae bacterium AER2_44_116]|nr:conjugal transfer protein TraB [Moraxellaceae bacterium AER2_44_116]